MSVPLWSDASDSSSSKRKESDVEQTPWRWSYVGACQHFLCQVNLDLIIKMVSKLAGPALKRSPFSHLYMMSLEVSVGTKTSQKDAISGGNNNVMSLLVVNWILLCSRKNNYQMIQANKFRRRCAFFHLLQAMMHDHVSLSNLSVQCNLPI